MHLGHQRAGRVDRLESALLGLRVDRGRDAVGGEDDGGALGHLVELLDEDRTARLEVGDDVLVVDDLLADVDRRAVQVERLLHRDHRAVHAGAVAAGGGEPHALAPRTRACRGPHSCRRVYVDDGRDPRTRDRCGRVGAASAVRVGGRAYARGHGPGDLARGARAGAADRPGDLGLGRPARPGVGRGTDGADQPAARARHRVHDDARLGRRHLDPRDLRSHPLRQPQPAAGRGRQRGDPRQARLLRQPRHASRWSPARSGWSGSASCSPGSSVAASSSRPRVCSTPELKKPLPFLPRCVGLVTAQGSAAERDVVENARRRWPGVTFETAYAAMQGSRAANDVIDALARLDRHPDVDVIVVARGRRLGRGPAAVQRRGPGPRGGRHADPGRVRDRSRARHPAARPRRRRARLDADRRRQAAGARHGRGAARGRLGDPADPRAGPAAGRPRVAGAGRPAVPSGARRSRAPCSTRGGSRSPTCATGPAASSPTPSLAPATTSPTSAPAPGRCRRWPRSSAGTPSSRPPTGRSSRRRTQAAVGADLSIRLADGRVLATTSAVEPAPIPEEDHG